MTNPEVEITLDEAVSEVLGQLTGLDLTYVPELDRYRSITRQLNRALRANALEQEWGYYASTLSLGGAVEGDTQAMLPSSKRVRVIADDAVRLVDEEGRPIQWAYFLPRDALHKYRWNPRGLWCSATRTTLEFSRPFSSGEDGLEILVPVMREPLMFRLPAHPEDPNAPLVDVPDEIRDQPLDFEYPDCITLRAAYYYAQTDPVMQPRVQTLEAEYKDVMYQVMERDSSFTDTPYSNPFVLPVQGELGAASWHDHPLSDHGR